MIRRSFVEAWRLVRPNFVLLASIIFAAAIPGNLLAFAVPYLLDFRTVERETWAMVVSLFFYPIAVGAFVFALGRIRAGEAVTFRAAYSEAWRRYKALFLASLGYSAVTILGALLFVVPGILAMIRYAFVFEAVVLEDRSARDAFSRAASLTDGLRSEIFGAGLAFYGVLAAIGIAAAAILGVDRLHDIHHNPLWWTVVECGLNLLDGFFAVVLFAFYWEARNRERHAEPSDAAGDEMPVA